jgi:hypothetical protein
VAAGRAFHSLRKILRFELVSRKTKLLIYKTSVRAVITWASETWALTKIEEKSLCSFETRILRYIFGAVLKNGKWRRRYTKELYLLFEEPDVVKCIKLNRLRWCGHVRMNPQRTAQKIFNFKPFESRKIGRPKLRWEVGVLQDTMSLDVKNWRNMATRREEWQGLLWKAKAHSGLSSQ